MLRLFRLCILALVIITQGCSSPNKKAVSEQSSKDSMSVVDSGDSIDIEAASVKADDYEDNFENPFDTLVGCWAAIREGNITITFARDSTFEFYDYNSKLKEKELLTGKIELRDSILILHYSDRPKQRFEFKKETERKNEYRITNSSGYYFIKSPC